MGVLCQCAADISSDQFIITDGMYVHIECVRVSANFVVIQLYVFVQFALFLYHRGNDGITTCSLTREYEGVRHGGLA